ncbi:uncharacterized protein LOC128200112 [Galleria mellonella]|uniref:Uncharacterized protein LOC128200112 n=1 Tax=Galleria mellonella TaxID=7137 RepID=A0ABM3MB17_GALME|nr:uncharacterized protein LOC128200112 [Galleria mellonella]
MFGDKRVNENGESLLEVCLERNLVVTNTLFSHKLIHMYTWQRQTERSMIDFVIVDERLRAKVKDTRVYRGTNVGTDHFLVISRIGGLFNKWRHRPRVRMSEIERVRVERLTEEQVRNQYQERLNERFRELLKKDNYEIEEFWKDFKCGIFDIATQVCGVSKRKDVKIRMNVWWDGEVKEMVALKKKAWMDLLATRANKRMQGNIVCRKLNTVVPRYMSGLIYKCIETRAAERAIFCFEMRARFEMRGIARYTAAHDPPPTCGVDVGV